MKIDLLNHLFKRFKQSQLEKKATEEKIQRSHNVTALHKQAPDHDAEVDAIVSDILENGIPETESDHLLAALVHQHFGGILPVYPDKLAEIRTNFSVDYFSKVFHQEFERYFPDAYDTFINYSEYGNEDLNIVLYAVNEKLQELSSSVFKRARSWVGQHEENYKQGSSRGSKDVSGNLYRSWLPGEDDPKEDPGFKKKHYDTIAQFQEKARIKRDPIYGGRPEEVLTPPRPELNESFSYLCLQLSGLLEKKYRDKIDYQNSALALGKKAVRLIPQAQDQAERDARKTYEQWKRKHPKHAQSYEHYLNNELHHTVKENTGLARYVNLLIDIGKFDEAIEVCDRCIKHNIHDGTKRGFAGRKQKAERKQPRKETANQPRGRKGRLTDEQILELVGRYLKADSEERKSLMNEYGVSQSNLYYLVSKNRYRIEDK